MILHLPIVVNQDELEEALLAGDMYYKDRISLKEKYLIIQTMPVRNYIIKFKGLYSIKIYNHKIDY